tara:strand:+ start:326 stop:544 length:219 start_codon:yes stop_codon:yes gene_type:complete
MEYITFWQPLLLIFISFLIGAFFGALAMFWSMHTDNELLRIDAEINEEKLLKCQDRLDRFLDKYEEDDYEAY